MDVCGGEACDVVGGGVGGIGDGGGDGIWFVGDLAGFGEEGAVV